MENLGDYGTALQFIHKLPVDHAEVILASHGKELLDRLPKETTEVLIELCSEWKGPPRTRDISTISDFGNAQRLRLTANDPSLPDHRANASDFIPAFVDSPLCLMRFLESVVRNSLAGGENAPTADDEKVVYNTLLELYLTKELRKTIKHVDPTLAPEASNTTSAAGSPSPDDSDTWTVPPYEQRLETAMQILEDHYGQYDPWHALVLSQQHQFERGILFLLERMKLFSEILSHHAQRFETGETKEVRERAKLKLVALCEDQTKKGTSEEEQREMWIQLLTLLVRSKDDVSEDITRVLARVEQDDLLPPVVVIEILSSNKSIPLKTVRDYLIRMLRKDTDKIDRYQAEVKERREKIQKFREEVKDLSTQATVFQTNRCAACSTPIDLPAVHFLCKHSFHQRCLNDTRECNICGPEAKRVLQLQREYDEKVNDHDEFFKSVASAKDGFSVVAEYYGRGIFSAPLLKKHIVSGSADHADDEIEDEDEDEDDYGDVAGVEELENPEEVETW